MARRSTATRRVAQPSGGRWVVRTNPTVEAPKRQRRSTVRFRVTLPGNYGLSTPGFTDPGARQGHYSRATTSESAAREVFKRLHMEGMITHFDVEPWDDTSSRSGPGVQRFAVGPRSSNARRLMHNPTDVEIRERFDRCVRDVSVRGGAYNPNAVCAASMRKAYGTQFQRIAASGRSAKAAERHERGLVLARASGRLERRPASRLRRTAVQRRGELSHIRSEKAQAYRRAFGSQPRVLAAVANPVEQLIQSRIVAPGHVIFEWVDVARGRWVDASRLAGEPRRPSRKPGTHLVAPGAQLLVMQGPSGPSFQYNRALFVRHHKHWRMVSSMSHPVEARVGHGIEVAGKLSPADRAVMTMLSAYAAASLRGRNHAIRGGD